MKKGSLRLLLGGFLFTAAPLMAQQPKIGCIDKGIRLQAEQMKHDFKEQGMTVLRDAMLGMSSKEFYPVAVDLAKGNTYQLIFIGSKMASRMDFELYDDQKKRLDEKHISDPSQSNFIIYSISPERSGTYIIAMKQKLKNNELCGSITILQKGNGENTNGEQNKK